LHIFEGRKYKVIVMKKILFLGAIFIFGNILQAQTQGWLTWYELSGYLETPRYDKTIEYCKQLDNFSPLVQYTSFGKSPQGRDLPLLIIDKNQNFTPESVRASGNAVLNDIGIFMRDQIVAYFKHEKIQVIMRYIDPSYLIRSSRANAEDSILCDLFARNAVHAAMAGKTGLVIGYLHDKFIHIPIELLASQAKSMDTKGFAWRAVLAATGQPERFG